MHIWHPFRVRYSKRESKDENVDKHIQSLTTAPCAPLSRSCRTYGPSPFTTPAASAPAVSASVPAASASAAAEQAASVLAASASVPAPSASAATEQAASASAGHQESSDGVFYKTSPPLKIYDTLNEYIFCQKTVRQKN